ncbi:energy transducer TonB [Flavobacterium sp. NRK F10]|uniref:energy transducer TonB n=1 Tax=Flavobacterium sp. NRK F10 TaxID=2954931 RepID=UPI00209096E6|nr:energy transducer TonB [Flavobacterium sp. NRK F10]MCO6174350.1 energy transducer TonB [Flavobacterium sp. NRK F10]
MKFLETEEEKKSFVITSAIFVMLFLLITFLGLSYMDPPPENGIAINFGTSDVGQGEIQPTEPIKSAPQPSVSQPVTSQNDEVLTQDEDSPVTVIPTKNDTKPKTETPKETPKPKVETPKPSKEATNALDALLNGPKSDGQTTGGHGNDGLPGDKGDPNGSIYANSFYGNGSGNGSGNGTGWGLAGRKLAGNSKKVQDCNEEGRVVVKVWVNRNGTVIKAERTQGTTNTNPCLVNPALETAKSFKWQPDAKAPETQIGFVVINFKLGE